MPAGPGPLTTDEQALLERGVAQWNNRLFFECHDTLEELWSGLHGEARGIVQGLVQLAVGFYHLGNANRTGALRLFDRGLSRLEGAGEGWSGLDLRALREAVGGWRDAVARGEAFPDGGPPRIPLAGGGAPPAAIRQRG